MANQIGAFFVTADADREAAVAGIADHLEKFWDPSMRRELAAHVAGGSADDLQAEVREAVERLMRPPAGAATALRKS